MAIHRVDALTLGVPDLVAATTFYDDFGLTPSSGEPSTTPSAGEVVTFATVDGGDQLRLVASPVRRLVRATFAADDPDDLERCARDLNALGVATAVDRTETGSATTLLCIEVATATEVCLRVRPRLVQPLVPAPVYNGPGRLSRRNERADGVVRSGRVRPRRLGHFVVGTTDFEVTKAFFCAGLGFKVSDIIKDFGVFLRCSEDHHNVLVQRAPVPFLHHTSWQVEDIDEIGRGAMDMLSGNAERHVWGLGRHFAGSNFFWYLKDPAGNFAEYHSDMDCIPEDAIWEPEVLEGALGLYRWGPPPPPSFLDPEDLADLMISGHQ